MIEHVTIERQSKDRLVEWKWRFYYDSHVLWLDYYGEFQRPTRRHGFTCTQSYSRLDNRGHGLAESDVVLPAEVIHEAITSFCKGIAVKRWSERR